MMSNKNAQPQNNPAIEFEMNAGHPTQESNCQTRDAKLDEFKRRAQEQWGANPCGAHIAKELPFGTREYFDAIEDYRYNVYAPWMKQEIGFAQYTGKRLVGVGCGTGTDSLQFARGGAIFTGVDLTP